VASEAELAWLAGLLEGEGSFWMLTSHVGGKRYRYPKIVVSMTDRDIIERVAHLFGRSVYDVPPSRGHPNRLPAFRAQISGAAAAQWMRDLYPWLGRRRQGKIDEVLAEYGEIEPTSVRRSRACREAALRRYGHDLSSSSPAGTPSTEGPAGTPSAGLEA
jgi:hypothetical protein